MVLKRVRTDDSSKYRGGCYLIKMHHSRGCHPFTTYTPFLAFHI